jgi:hypothetical protein
MGMEFVEGIIEETEMKTSTPNLRSFSLIPEAIDIIIGRTPGMEMIIYCATFALINISL